MAIFFEVAVRRQRYEVIESVGDKHCLAQVSGPKTPAWEIQRDYLWISPWNGHYQADVCAGQADFRVFRRVDDGPSEIVYREDGTAPPIYGSVAPIGWR
jgi:hypothetical protein